VPAKRCAVGDDDLAERRTRRERRHLLEARDHDAAVAESGGMPSVGSPDRRLRLRQRPDIAAGCRDD